MGIQSPVSDAMVVGIAWDAGAQLVWFTKNGTVWNNNFVAGANPATGVGGGDCSFASATDHALWYTEASSGGIITLRTEKDEFTLIPPAGYVSWMGKSFGDMGSLPSGERHARRQRHGSIDRHRRTAQVGQHHRLCWRFEIVGHRHACRTCGYERCRWHSPLDRHRRAERGHGNSGRDGRR